MHYTKITVLLVLLLLTAGCAEPDSSDYSDSPETVQDRSLDYQDYKEAECPYLEQSLDHETMKKCNKWIKANQTETSHSD